jgi:hypothetical protein
VTAVTVIRTVAESDDDVYVLGLRAGDDPWSLLLMEADPDGDPDALHSDDEFDSYCLVVDPGQMTVYGGVVEAELMGDFLRLTLTQVAAETLEMREEELLQLSIPESQREVLGRGLTRVLTSGALAFRPALLRV